MFPCSKHEPAALGKQAVTAGVALPIGGDLGLPPVGVRLRRDGVHGATVPETAVHLHGEPGTREDDVGPTGQVLNVHSEAQPPTVEFSPQREFGPCTGGSLPGHEGGHL